MLDAKNWKGKSAGTPLSSFDREELTLGIRDEMEHTDDQQIAARIAADHLMSDKHYYSKLKKLGIYEQRLRDIIKEIALPLLKTKQ